MNAQGVLWPCGKPQVNTASEGKGDVVAAITRERMANKLNEKGTTYAVRVGGPNAGHTILDASGEERKVQSIPVSGLIDPLVSPVLGASAVIDLGILLRELGWRRHLFGASVRPLLIDRLATVILPEHHQQEVELKGRISSTGEGVGAATAAKVMRVGLTLASAVEKVSKGEVEGIDSEVADQLGYLAGCRDRGEVIFTDTVRGFAETLLAPRNRITVIVEGTQGYQLSLNTSGNYPYVTSRDCGPEAIMGQIGINPRQFGVSHFVAVFRTFPIRVGGPSGPLPNEVTWEEMSEMTGGYITTPETTTVTKKNRRIGRWDDRTAHRTVLETCPTEVVFTFVDYISPAAASARRYEDLPIEAIDWIEATEQRLGIRASWIASGPHNCYRRG